MKRFSLCFLVVLCVLVQPFVMAVDRVELHDAANILAALQARAGGDSNVNLLRGVLGLDENTTLRLLRQNSTRDMTHSRYELVYRNVPVWSVQIIITEDSSSRVVRLHGTAITGLEKDITDVTPAFDAQAALTSMKEHHRTQAGARMNWQYENESSRLVIYVNSESRAMLSYAVTFFADVEEGGQATRPYYIVDARSGGILYQYENLQHENEGGSKATGPGGNQKTGRYEYGKEYGPMNVAFANNTSTMLTTDVKTVNLNGGSSGSTAYSFTGTVNTVKEINGAYSPLNDAHYFGGMVFSLFKDWYDTTPLTFQLTLRVHYSTNYENAFWNGSSMTFGDGRTRFYPLVSLDVVAHEVSHGFTEQNSALVYSGQSGGINETFSDVCGEAAEYFMRGKNDWMVGSEIFKATGALRYLDDPPKDGRSIGSAKNFTNGMDVHYSSGVFNKAFYTLANRPGWNTRKAFDAFVKANQNYWPNNATFVSGAVGVRDAAKDLGYPTNDVVTAFQAVDVVITAVE